MHWKAIPTEFKTPSGDVFKTLWAIASEKKEYEIKIDEKSLVENFTKAQKQAQKDTSSGQAKLLSAKKISIIDAKRSTNINISLSKFPSPDILLESVKNISFSEFSGDLIDIVTSNLIPTEEEMEQVQNYVKEY